MLAVPNRPYRQDFRPFTIVQGDIVVGKESNRRSGESRNPGNLVGKERAGYRHSNRDTVIPTAGRNLKRWPSRTVLIARILDPSLSFRVTL